VVIRLLADGTNIINEAYRLARPLSPYDSAKYENIEINTDKILQTKIPDDTVIEGAGGLLVPIHEEFQMVDLARSLNSEILVVARSRLGFLNHIFMTIEILRSRNIKILGIVLNGETELVGTVERFSKTRVLGILPITSSLDKVINETPLPDEIVRALRITKT
jgi:dethiobiotin synthetase